METSPIQGPGNAVCVYACPVHCRETVELLNAHLIVRLRWAALLLSAICIVSLLIGSMLYSFHFEGKQLPLPLPAEMFWFILSAPWLGEGAARLASIAKGGEK